MPRQKGDMSDCFPPEKFVIRGFRAVNGGDLYNIIGILRSKRERHGIIHRHMPSEVSMLKVTVERRIE